MTRMTPRTCLWPITFTLLGTFALSIGLTYVSDHHCYAGTCGEWLFPLQTRLHIVTWYFWISISVTVLGIRAFSPELRRRLRYPLMERKLPMFGKHFAVSGLLVLVWVLVLYGAIIGIWWWRLKQYFVDRGTPNGVVDGNYRLAALALTGHICDVTMGMVLLPISRHSALASFFKLSVSTTLVFHMCTAYTLFIFILVHGFLYVSWIPVWHALSSELRHVYPVLNPTYLYNEAWPGNTSSLGIWRASLVFTGLFTATIMLLIFATTLPQIRKSHFNVFYFTHLLVVVAVIVICLHASTMFYCTAPGLVLWVVDWGMRIYELRTPIDGKVTTIGNGYYVLAMKMPRHRLDGCACTSPLAHFYIYHSESSIRELHPFSTITHLASENMTTPKNEYDITIQFLFRKQSHKLQHVEPALDADSGFAATFRKLISPKTKQKVQWTEKLASLADQDLNAANLNSSGSVTPQRRSSAVSFGPDHFHPVIDIPLRLEGPYFTPADPARYRTVICLVAGTGISGAIAIAAAFTETERQRVGLSECGPVGGACMAATKNSIWQRCIVVWSVREDDYIDMPFLKSSPASALETRIQLTGKGRSRIDFFATLTSIVEPSAKGSTWVYLSGPNAYIRSGEEACKELGLEWYGARWDI